MVFHRRSPLDQPSLSAVAPPGGRGEASPLWVDVQKLCNVCAFIVMELLRITRQMHCKAVEQRATLIHRQYNRDWGTSYSRPPIDPYLTPPVTKSWRSHWQLIAGTAGSCCYRRSRQSSAKQPQQKYLTANDYELEKWAIKFDE